jgi:serine/threonine-protein kinase RsbT
MRWRSLQADRSVGIELMFEDQGPGIADIQEVMAEGYTTSGGLGMGLPGSKRLMGEMDIQSQLGKGTTIKVRKWMRRP